jgi:hypothetical protein
MGKPTKLHDIQKLVGRIAALSRFIARLGEKALPFYALMKKSDDKFEWTEEADTAFTQLKKCFPHHRCWLHQSKRSHYYYIYRSNTSSGEHSISSQKERRRKSSWSPEASIFRQRSTISNKAKVPTLPETCI